MFKAVHKRWHCRTSKNLSPHLWTSWCSSLADLRRSNDLVTPTLFDVYRNKINYQITSSQKLLEGSKQDFLVEFRQCPKTERRKVEWVPSGTTSLRTPQTRKHCCENIVSRNVSPFARTSSICCRSKICFPRSKQGSKAFFFFASCPFAYPRNTSENNVSAPFPRLRGSLDQEKRLQLNNFKQHNKQYPASFTSINRLWTTLKTKRKALQLSFVWILFGNLFTDWTDVSYRSLARNWQPRKKVKCCSITFV